MAASSGSFHMSPSDLIKKEPLDYGGSGDVYLCYHKTLGQVVLKKVYTGSLRNEGSRRSLLEEGSLMTQLNHERVVKLLGVILENGDYSLVMELIPKGNLLAMLKQVPVAISIKGRIILEILEGMVYLTENNVMHKDLKPENILVDKDFHIKIADLCLATCQTWSKLTKEESRRRRGSAGIRGAGTLSYMAPEHLESINTHSTEKSDVYSFAIVVWVILACREPYEHARSDDHICQCVRNGDRPADNLIPENTPVEIIDLMKRCWHQDPQQRPTFDEGYKFFQPVYMDQLEPYVESDSLGLMNSYEGPEDLVEKMKFLSMAPDSLAAGDCPAPLLSSDGSLPILVPVEASIEDLHFLPFDHRTESSIQADAKAVSGPSAVDRKLEMELQYHKHGSYNSVEQPDPSHLYHHGYPYAAPQRLTSQDLTARQPVQDWPTTPVSSVQSWTRADPVQPASQEGAYYHPTHGLYESMTSSVPRPTVSPMSTSISSPSLGERNPYLYGRQQSWPTFPVPDTTAPDPSAVHRLTPNKMGSLLQDQGGVFIQKASGIQIGHGNVMSISEPIRSYKSLSNGSANSLLKETIRKYEDHTVTEEHLDLLRDNIGSQWKRCARRLGLTDVEVDTIEHDYHSDGLFEMVHQMLERWRMKEGSVGCTVGKLCKALEGHIKVDLIQKLLNVCQSNSST